ncbi:hypothetical protein MMC13_005885 [Lambiella insularis]|nr:hypothetical protein [Lambiella insularis]
MSASPADQTPGSTPNGTLRPLLRRPRAAADPLVRPKKPRRPNPHATNGMNGTAQQNGLAVPRQGQTQVMAQRPPKPHNKSNLQASSIITGSTEQTSSLFSSPPPGPYVDYPLIVTKGALAEGLRFHVAKFYSKKNIDPRNEEEFTQPVRLHRRDPRAPPGGGGGGKQDAVMGGMDSKDGILDDKEREKQDMLRAQRDAEREAEMAQVAPSANKSNQRRGGAFKKKIQQVFRNDQTEEQKAETKLRYEEAIPWHLEDFDNKQIWVGNYEKALSESYAQLVHRDGKFYVTPIEKWYKFAPKTPFETLSIDEAEKIMDKKVKDPRFITDLMKANQAKQQEALQRKAGRRLYMGKSASHEDGKVANATMKREAADVDELDFEEDRFADDEENNLFEGELEDAKDAEDRIKRDQLQANVFDLKDEKSYDKAENLEKREKEAQKKLSRKIIKALRRQEKNFAYESASDNPYSSDDGSSDSEAEREQEEEAKREEEEKKAAAADKPKPPLDSSSRGTHAHSNRPGKHPDPLNRTASSSSLKRPGSPNLSEASGNESSRKKHKKKHALSSNLNTGISTPNGPPSRPRSPNPPTSSAPDSATARSSSAQPQSETIARKPSTIRLNVKPENPSSAPSRSDHKRPRPGAASGSEGETAPSGGEMSDGGRKRVKLKLTRPGSTSPTPRDSRAGSPDVPGHSSRAASPGKCALHVSLPLTERIIPIFLPVVSRELIPIALGATPPPAIPFPTPGELRAAIPPEGTTISVLLRSFPGAINNKVEQKRFTDMLRTISKYDKETHMLKRLD